MCVCVHACVCVCVCVCKRLMWEALCRHLTQALKVHVETMVSL